MTIPNTTTDFLTWGFCWPYPWARQSYLFIIERAEI